MDRAYPEHIISRSRSRRDETSEELGWAAIWLYLQTREERYLEQANEFIPHHALTEFSWEEKSPGYMVGHDDAFTL